MCLKKRTVVSAWGVFAGSGAGLLFLSRSDLKELVSSKLMAILAVVKPMVGFNTFTAMDIFTRHLSRQRAHRRYSYGYCSDPVDMDFLHGLTPASRWYIKFEKMNDHSFLKSSIKK